MPAISNAEYNRLLKAEAELKELKQSKLIQQFVDELKEAILLGLVQIPLAKWPHPAKTAWQHVAKRIPTAARIYYKRFNEEK